MPTSRKSHIRQHHCNFTSLANDMNAECCCCFKAVVILHVKKWSLSNCHTAVAKKSMSTSNREFARHFDKMLQITKQEVIGVSQERSFLTNDNSSPKFRPQTRDEMQQTTPQKETFLLQCFTKRTGAFTCKFESHECCSTTETAPCLIDCFQQDRHLR